MKKIVPPFLRTAHNYDTNQASDETAIRCEEPPITKQSFVEECDINTIVRRFHLTGELPQNVHAPTYGDFTGVFDFQTAMNAITQANESFMAMPADVRARFHNNAQEFVEFCSDEKNRQEAERLGLVVAKPKPENKPTPEPQNAAKPPSEPSKGDKKSDS